MVSENKVYRTSFSESKISSTAVLKYFLHASRPDLQQDLPTALHCPFFSPNPALKPTNRTTSCNSTCFDGGLDLGSVVDLEGRRSTSTSRSMATKRKCAAVIALEDPAKEKSPEAEPLALGQVPQLPRLQAGPSQIQPNPRPQSLPTRKLFPDFCQFRLWFVRKVLQLSSSPIPILAVVLIPFNLVQDGVDPTSGRVFVLLDDSMSRVPFTG
jgi:hypothetical protein